MCSLATDTLTGLLKHSHSTRMATAIVVNASAGMSDAQHLGNFGQYEQLDFLGARRSNS